MHILHLILASDEGGLSRYLVDIATASAAQGHRITVAGDVGAAQVLYDRAPVTYVRIPLKEEVWQFKRSRKALHAALASLPPVDVIHTHYRRGTLLGRRLQRDWARNDDQPVSQLLYTLHLSHISLRLWRGWASDFGDWTHAASVDARDWLLQKARVPADRIVVIPHGVDVARFSPRTTEQRTQARKRVGVSEDDLVVLYVGRLEYPKNPEWMLSVAEAARAQGLGGVKIFLAGQGPQEAQLRQRIAESGLSDSVRLLGHIDPLPLYQAGDALLLPSLREGFSLVCAEAMAVGLPALRTRTTGTTELIDEGVTGRSVPIDQRIFVDEAIKFLRDREGLARMGAAASQRVRENYTFDKQIEGTLALYQRLCGSAGLADADAASTLNPREGK